MEIQPSVKAYHRLRHLILVVGFYFALLQGFGDDAEHAPAIKVVNPVRDRGKFEIAQDHSFHGNSALGESLSSPAAPDSCRWLLLCAPTGFWGRRRTCPRHQGGKSRQRPR